MHHNVEPAGVIIDESGQSARTFFATINFVWLWIAVLLTVSEQVELPVTPELSPIRT
jgi:hypothetical protein